MSSLTGGSDTSITSWEKSFEILPGRGVRIIGSPTDDDYIQIIKFMKGINDTIFYAWGDLVAATVGKNGRIYNIIAEQSGLSQSTLYNLTYTARRIPIDMRPPVPHMYIRILCEYEMDRTVQDELLGVIDEHINRSDNKPYTAREWRAFIRDRLGLPDKNQGINYPDIQDGMVMLGETVANEKLTVAKELLAQASEVIAVASGEKKMHQSDIAAIKKRVDSFVFEGRVNKQVKWGLRQFPIPGSGFAKVELYVVRTTRIGDVVVFASDGLSPSELEILKTKLGIGG